MSDIQTVDTEPLSAKEIVFSKHIANGYSLTKAYLKAFPEKKDLKIETIRNYASKLMMNSDISLEVATQQSKQSRLARLAEERIEQQLTEGRDGRVTADVAMFMYDHANGKAVQKQEIVGKHVHVTYDLSGSGEEVPQDVLDQLEE